MDEGWTRFVFDTFNVPFQSVSETAINTTDPRAKFDAIVLPSEQTRPTGPDGRRSRKTREELARPAFRISLALSKTAAR